MSLSTLSAPSVVDEDLRFSSTELERAAARVASGLLAAGVQPGDVVAWWLPNWWEAVALYLATWKIGATAAPLHHRLSEQEVTALVARLKPRALLVASGYPHLRGAMTVRGKQDGFRRLLNHEIAVGFEADPGTFAVVLATSGSSGEPKLVRHTYAGLAHKAQLMVRVHGLTAEDTVLMPAPLAHVSGLLNGVLLPGQASMTTVLMERWVPDDALALINDNKVTFLIGPPTYFYQLMGSPRFSAPTVRLISCGGAGVTEAFARKAAERFNAVVKRTYGSTEAPTVTTSHVGDPVEKGWATDGRPVGDVELRIIDGEIVVRGSELFHSYADGPGRDHEGWYRTGDTGTLSGDGWLTVTGRLSDVIIRGGENVAPGEVEAVCGGMHGIAHCVAVGYPDTIFGERIGLVVEGPWAPTLTEVHAHCERMGLARFKWPEKVMAVATLPTLTVGKPDRRALGQAIAEYVMPVEPPRPVGPPRMQPEGSDAPVVEEAAADDYELPVPSFIRTEGVAEPPAAPVAEPDVFAEDDIPPYEPPAYEPLFDDASGFDDPDSGFPEFPDFLEPDEEEPPPS